MTIKPIANNAAADALIATQTATTQIKELIVDSAIKGFDEKETTMQLNKLISTAVNKLNGELLKESVRRSLVTAAKRWHWQITNSMQILNRNLANTAQVKNNIYSVEILAALGNSKGYLIDALRPYLDYSQSAIVPVIENYQRSVKTAIRALATQPAKVVQLRDGKAYVMPLRNYAEMTVRYQANLDNVQGLVDKGVKLTWVSSHPNASPRCAPYQGKLYSLDGTSGTINGISYTPLQDALAGINKDGNGIISGYNCRHRLVEYVKGSTAPIEYTYRQIKKEYAIDQMQRRFENNIRHLKTESKLLRKIGETDEARQLELKARRLTKAYQGKSIKAGRAYYPYRYIVDESEVTFAEQQIA